jgi:hypothetical protein
MTIRISELGNLTAVYGNVVVPVVAEIAGTLVTVKGNLDQLTSYIVSGPAAAIASTDANIVLSNITLKDYVDGQISSANTGIITANIGVIGYIDNEIIIVNSNIASANISLKDYVDGQISAANAEIVTANIGMTGYVDDAVTTANIGMTGYVDDAVTTANIGMTGYVDAQTYSNVQVETYLPTYSGDVASLTITESLSVTDSFVVFGNLFVANAYVPPLSNSSGTTGQITYDGDYVYVCVDTDDWRRANLVAW